MPEANYYNRHEIEIRFDAGGQHFQPTLSMSEAFNLWIELGRALKDGNFPYPAYWEKT